MKSIKQLSFIGLAIMLVLASCTMEKRLHMSGYHIDWKKNNHSLSEQALVKDNIENHTEQNETVTRPESSMNASSSVDGTSRANNENVIASVDNSQIVLPQKRKVNLHSGVKVKPPSEQNEVKPSSKNVFKKGNKAFPSNTDEEPKMSGMAIAGFVCGIVGLILVLLTGWPFLLGTLATIFSIIGLSQTSKGKKGKGFAIAGLITGILAIVIFWIWVAIIISVGL